MRSHLINGLVVLEAASTLAQNCGKSIYEMASKIHASNQAHFSQPFGKLLVCRNLFSIISRISD